MYLLLVTETIIITIIIIIIIIWLCSGYQSNKTMKSIQSEFKMHEV